MKDPTDLNEAELALWLAIYAAEYTHRQRMSHAAWDNVTAAGHSANVAWEGVLAARGLRGLGGDRSVYIAKIIGEE